MTRRVFLQAAAAVPALSAPAPGGVPQFCIFSKHMARFNYDELGRHAKQIGFDGVDLTVREKGHVLPERAAQDLPKAVDAVRSHGLLVPMITTGILRRDEPAARPTLATAASLKIPFWKPGYHRYDLNNVEQSMERIRTAVAGLAALSREHGVVAGFHNHSGDYVGSAVWDIRALIHDLDPKWIGYYFDPCHATIEGGLAGWRIAQNIVSSRLKMVSLKDFYWEKAQGQWNVKWCPMGEGMVDWPRVFGQLASIRFAGPLTLHIEYEAKDELDAIAKDAAFVKKQIAAAFKA